MLATLFCIGGWNRSEIKQKELRLEALELTYQVELMGLELTKSTLTMKAVDTFVMQDWAECMEARRYYMEKGQKTMKRNLDISKGIINDKGLSEIEKKAKLLESIKSKYQ